MGGRVSACCCLEMRLGWSLCSSARCSIRCTSLPCVTDAAARPNVPAAPALLPSWLVHSPAALIARLLPCMCTTHPQVQGRLLGGAGDGGLDGMQRHLWAQCDGACPQPQRVDRGTAPFTGGGTARGPTLRDSQQRHCIARLAGTAAGPMQHACGKRPHCAPTLLH